MGITWTLDIAIASALKCKGDVSLSTAKPGSLDPGFGNLVNCSDKKVVCSTSETAETVIEKSRKSLGSFLSMQRSQTNYPGRVCLHGTDSYHSA